MFALTNNNVGDIPRVQHPTIPPNFLNMAKTICNLGFINYFLAIDSFRKSITTNTVFKKGDMVSIDRVAFKRPGTGISPDLLKYVVGRKVNKDIEDDKTLRWDDLT